MMNEEAPINLTHLKRIHTWHVWGRRINLAVFISLCALSVKAGYSEYVERQSEAGSSVANAVFLAALSIGLLMALALIPRWMLGRILTTVIRHRVKRLSIKTGQSRQAILQSALGDAHIAADRRFLPLIDRAGYLYVLACRNMHCQDRRLFDTLADWLRVTEGPEVSTPQTDPKVRGLALLWQSLVYLIAAEHTRIYSPISGSFSYETEHALTWREAAKQAVQRATEAEELLGSAVGSVVSVVTNRADAQIAIGKERAQKDHRWQSDERVSRYGASVLRSSDFAVLHSKLTVRDLVDLAKGLPGNEILTDCLVGTK